ncbi:MAG: helix-turn-helix domain-containing protein [Mariprofundaceae bacterium]|nr:helix-turn-helix domain-containing protein [Mariprofundaceae bacterium]
MNKSAGKQKRKSGDAHGIDYYEVLRLSPQASKLDIINAYRKVKLTFRNDSLAVYSLYTDEDLETIRKQIDAAYAVLSDREKRDAYDRQREDFRSKEKTSNTQKKAAPQVAMAKQDDGKHSGANNVVSLRSKVQSMDYNPELERRIRSATSFPGVMLREVREYRGISLDELAGHTRISMSYLKGIEAEDVACLPALAYLKGYLAQYAAEIGLEPHRVVQGYPPLVD